jgi:hypothetical protein
MLYGHKKLLMNWHQVYSAAPVDERYEFTQLIFRRIESRRRRLVFAGMRLVRERRLARRYHFVGDRRRYSRPWAPAILASWAGAVAIYAIIVLYPDHRFGILLATGYGLAAALYLMIRSSRAILRLVQN